MEYLSPNNASVMSEDDSLLLSPIPISNGNANANGHAGPESNSKRRRSTMMSGSALSDASRRILSMSSASIPEHDIVQDQNWNLITTTV